MSGLVDNVLANLNSDQIGAIASRLGVDPAQAQAAIEHAVPLIVGGMAQNASSPAGDTERRSAPPTPIGIASRFPGVARKISSGFPSHEAP